MDNLNEEVKQHGSPPVFEQGKLVFKCIMYMMKVGANSLFEYEGEHAFL